jgi:hypothetical protein
MAVRFTQYLQPDGRQVPTDIDLDEEIERKAHALQAKGYVFEIEMLNVGPQTSTSEGKGKLLKALAGSDRLPDISMEIMKPFGDESLCGRLAVNGPDVIVKVTEMIIEGYALVFGGGDTMDVYDRLEINSVRQNRLSLVWADLDSGPLTKTTVARALVRAGVGKAFYLRRGLITLKEELRHEVSRIQTQIRENKKAGLDTSKLKGRLHGIEAVRKAVRALLHKPRKEAFTTWDFIWLAGALASEEGSRGQSTNDGGDVDCGQVDTTLGEAAKG